MPQAFDLAHVPGDHEQHGGEAREWDPGFERRELARRQYYGDGIHGAEPTGMGTPLLDEVGRDRAEIETEQVADLAAGDDHGDTGREARDDWSGNVADPTAEARCQQRSAARRRPHRA